MSITIKMMSSMATRPLLNVLIDAYAKSTESKKSGQPTIVLESLGGVNVVKRVEAGEPVDWIVLASDAIDALSKGGFVEPESKIDLFESSIAAAVPQGTRPIDMTSEAAVKAAVLQATRIGYSTGPSGAHLLRVFARWGIADEVAPKLVQSPAGIPVGAMLQKGQVSLGFQQLSELQEVSGICILGVLPDAVQSVTVFSMARSVHAQQRDTYAQWAAFLTSQQTHAVIRDNGMVPHGHGVD